MDPGALQSDPEVGQQSVDPVVDGLGAGESEDRRDPLGRQVLDHIQLQDEAILEREVAQRRLDSSLALGRLDRVLLIAVPAVLLTASRGIQTWFLAPSHLLVTLGSWIVFALVVLLLLGRRSAWPVLAAIGGAAGTGVVLGTRGKEIRLEPGTPVSVRLSAPLTVRVRVAS